jgi:hypothetical protein
MKLVLHIGTEKTGTTSVQTWLEGNRNALSCHGVFLSNVLDRPSNRALAHAFQTGIDPYFRPMGITSEPQVKAYRNRLMERLATEIECAAQTHDQFVISAEQLQSRLLSDREVAGLAATLGALFRETTVVCYLRPQIEMRRSLYSTFVRMGYTGPLESFDTDIDETSLYYNHEALVHRWAGAFGEDRLLLRDYARGKLHEADVVRDFAAEALPNLDLSALDFARGTENTALSGAHLFAYRAINQILPYIDGAGGFSKGNARAKRVFRAALAPFAPRLKSLSLSPREQAIGVTIASRFAASNRRLSETYFGGNLFSTLEGVKSEEIDSQQEQANDH